ncbi:DUF11 domain-containing protein, partial [Candidatus Bipolaricaulota bacterium]|nr:DUF11 domain-containing protein [Candidatus Bipolaricaulota bacterium]
TLKLLTVALVLILAVFLAISLPGFIPGAGEFVVYANGQGVSDDNSGTSGGNQGAADDCRNCDCRTGTSYRLTKNWESSGWQEDEDGGPLEVSLTITETNDDGEPIKADWSTSEYSVDCVVVESAGVEGTSLDACNTGDSPATSGSITSPATNPNNDKLQGISHISFCYDVTTGVDLAVEKTVDNPTPDKNSSVTFDVKLTNNGPDNATGVEIEDILPTGLNFQSATPGGDYDSSSGIWNVGSIDSGSSTTLEITAEATSYGKFTNTASLESLDQTDLVSTNNEDSATVVVIGLSDTFPDNFDVTQALLEENLGERCLSLGSFTVDGFDSGDYSLQAFYNIQCSGGTLTKNIIWIENQGGTSTACSTTAAGEYLSKSANSPTGLNGPSDASSVTFQTYLDLARAASTNLPDSCSISINIILVSNI